MLKQISTLRGLNFLYYSTSAVLTAFLPLYFNQKGFTSLQIGFLMMIGPFVSVFAQPIWGYLSDQFQTIKKIILIVWILSVLSSVGLFLANGFAGSFVFILLLYFFMIPSIPLLDSITIKSSQRAGISYGSIRLWGSVGFTTIALIGGKILERIGGIQNIQFLYWALWILPLTLLFFLKDEQSTGARITFTTLRSSLRNRQFLWFLCLVFIIMVPHRMNDNLFGLYLHDLGASNSQVGWAWALAALSEVPTFAILGRYIHRFNEFALLGVVSIIYTLRWILCGSITNPGILLFMQIFHCMTFAVFWITSLQYTVRSFPEELRSVGQSLLSAVFMGLAGITGGSLGGWVKEVWGGSTMYYAGAALTFIASGLFLYSHFVLEKRHPLKCVPKADNGLPYSEKPIGQ